jgi:hypothetical protein
MKVDWTDRQSVERYRERLMLALTHADYLSPIKAYQDALFKCHKALAAMDQTNDAIPHRL